jgi:hypothetical protein
MYIIIMGLPLLACANIVLVSEIFCFSMFTVYVWRLCVALVFWLALYICLSFLVASMRKALCILFSSSFIALSVSMMRFVQWVLVDFSRLYCSQ